MLGMFSADDASAEAVTYYGPEYCGNITASGDYLNCSAFSAAHPFLEFGTVVTVCPAACVTVVINDRGPNLDLSPAAATACGLIPVGRTDAPLIIH
jgi:rare lipoprotein A